jgi:hypothetical protein
VCTACRDKIATTLATATSSASFAKAALYGGAVAFASGAGYAIFVAVSHVQLALVTIGIAFVTAQAIRKATSGIGGLRFQVLAVALTYMASTMGFLPPILGGVHDGANHLFAVVLVALAAPFYELRESPLGLLIVLFGLWEAWRRTRGAPPTIEGPFQLAPAAAVPAPPSPP